MTVKEKEKSKYDTNPLDEDYARGVDREWDATRPIRVEPEERKEHWPAEAPTKRYDSSIPVSYPSINVPPSYPPKPLVTTPKRSALTGAPSSTRSVPGLGLPENITFALPYAPFFIGAIAGVLELFLTPRSETRARFHAAQGLALQLAAVAIKLVFNIVENITGTNVGGKVLWAASTVLFIIAMVRVWKGESVHVAAADEATEWLNERIDPRKH